MKPSYLFLILFLLSSFNIYAGDFVPYDWEKSRSRYTLTEKEQKYGEYILKIHNQFDYAFDKDQFVVYSTFHCIIYVNSNEAVDKNNQIYVSMYKTIDLVDLKARVITKNGKVIFFDKNNLKEKKDEESGGSYRIFAMEGVETGSEIEYFYTRKMYPDLYDKVYTQFNTPAKESSFLLSCPKHLNFDFKSYNNFSAVKIETIDDVNVYSAVSKSVPALKKEQFSHFDPNRMRIEYKLAYNTAKSKARMYTWDEAAKTFYRVLTNISSNDNKALDKFVKTLGDNPAKSKDERIKNIEEKIKSSVKVNEQDRRESLSEIESIIKFKLASKQGITKLFVHVFDKLKIECQPVITCSRETAKFDGEFDSWSFLDEYILYFPQADFFISPASFELRAPVIEHLYTAQKGLFIEPLVIGEVKSALASIKEIPALDYTINTDNLDISITFSADLESNLIKMKRVFGGINATYMAPYYEFMTEKQRGEMIEEVIKQTAPDLKINKWKANAEVGEKARNFLVEAEFQSSHFIERAGNRILFKVGELIGPQVEMYREDERTTAIENDFNRGYDRVIKLQIPAGYKVKNVNDLKLNVRYDNTEDCPYLFESTYSWKDGNILEVTIKEYYKIIFAPLSRYEDYRKVINAAADFNKITLVLEKG